jgi:hypothetical protein
MDDNSVNIQLEHYKLLRGEILQNSTEALKALDLGIVIVSVLFTLASSQVIPTETRWFFFLFPPIVVAPLIMLIAQRFRQTRKIGTYIGLRIEPKLGIAWESSQQKSVKQEHHISTPAHKNKRITPRSLQTMSFPLMAIQVLSWFASLSYLSSAGSVMSLSVVINWIMWGGSTIAIGYLLMWEYRVIQEALNKDFSQDV